LPSGTRPAPRRDSVRLAPATGRDRHGERQALERDEQQLYDFNKTNELPASNFEESHKIASSTLEALNMQYAGARGAGMKLKAELEQRASTVVEEHDDEVPAAEPLVEAELEEEAPPERASRAATPLPGDTPAVDAGDRRPHRRRGRRGGRRGRPGGENPSGSAGESPPGGGTPPATPEGE